MRNTMSQRQRLSDNDSYLEWFRARSAPENTKDTARERSVGGMIRDRMSMAADGAMASPTPTAARERHRPAPMGNLHVCGNGDVRRLMDNNVRVHRN